MDAIDRYQDSEYRILDDAIKHAIKRSACDAVRLGHLLRRMMEEKLWVGYYDSLDSYLRQELHMDYSMACRFEAINRKYSVGGRSGNIDEKWEDYSQGVLIEMLNMSPELEAKVTPDMTVRQVREIKRQARREKQKRKAETETVVAAEGEAPEACSISAEVPVQETDPLTESEEDGNGAEAFPAKDEVPDAEYRELDPVEEVATSQPAGSMQESEAGKEGDAVAREDAAEDVSGAEPDGPEPEASSERHIALQMATGSAYEEEPDSHAIDRLAEVKEILAKEQKMLDDFMEAASEDESVLESHMYKRLAVIVAALTAMVRSLEEAEAAEPDTEERKQPPLPPLKNNDQRREWLKSYKDWGLWYRDDNIGVDYYKYDFENGARLVVEVYQEEATRYYDAHEISFLHLVGGPEPQKGQHGICKWQRQGKYTKYPNSETELVEFLKEIQKKGGAVQ
nr:hypothetical protein [uncultured Acetatifactor sp.]